MYYILYEYIIVYLYYILYLYFFIVTNRYLYIPISDKQFFLRSYIFGFEILHNFRRK